MWAFSCFGMWAFSSVLACGLFALLLCLGLWAFSSVLACGLLALCWHVGFLLCCYALACTVVGFLLCSRCGLFALYAVASGFLLKLFWLAEAVWGGLAAQNHPLGFSLPPVNSVSHENSLGQYGSTLTPAAFRMVVSLSACRQKKKKKKKKLKMMQKHDGQTTSN